MAGPAVAAAEPASRGLVLGGGGAIRIGWEVGLLAGFADGGVDVTEADLIAGTSAGAAVGAHLALGADPADALDVVTALDTALTAERLEVGARALLDATAKAAPGDSPEQGLRALGRLAVEAETIDEARFLGIFAGLGGEVWPDRFVCTAIDVETGTLRVWDGGSGVSLQRAVATSAAVPFYFPPVTIANRRYVDGGLGNPLNPDLAAGRGRVVVVSCFPLGPLDGTGNPISAAIEAGLNMVRERGEAVEVIVPGEEFLAIGGGGADLAALMDPERAAAAYDAGVRQARVELDRVRAVWNG